MKPKLLSLLSGTIITFVLVSHFVFALDCGDPIPADKTQLSDYISKCSQSIDSARSKQQTLKSALLVLNSKISLVNAQIRQTTAQIVQLESDINTLSTVVSDLDKSLNDLTKVFLARVRAGYMRRDPNPITLFFSSDSFAKLFTRIRYLSIVKSRDQLILSEMATARIDYDNQKQAKITKQKQVEDLKVQLTSQQKDLASQQQTKTNLLNITHNNELRYQNLLEEAQAELVAIQAIITGNGSEKEIGLVKESDIIAHIIPTASPCSTGAHLHFETTRNQVDVDPAGLLGPRSVVWSNSPDSPVTFTGSWNWPLNGTVRINQLFGITSFAKTGFYGYYDAARTQPRPHTGIDMVNDDLNVKAVKAGTLYQGIIACGGGDLKYAHVRNKDDGYDTYYLHVNYN